MKTAFILNLFVLLFFCSGAHADAGANKFDGTWNTILSCPNAKGALGYSFQFPSTVKNGVLHGEKGTKDQPGWLQLNGTISPDGSANIYADGLVGAAPFAVGQRPAGTAYNYHIDANFSETVGTGHRVEGRSCMITFNKGK